jgi:hypothetical protein
MLSAERAILLQLKTVRRILFILHVVVIAALALSAGEAYLGTSGILSHNCLLLP